MVVETQPTHLRYKGSWSGVCLGTFWGVVFRNHRFLVKVGSVRVERGEEGVLERRVLGGLLEVAVHLASGREDALHPGRGRRRGEVLLDHNCWR